MNPVPSIRTRNAFNRTNHSARLTCSGLNDQQQDSKTGDLLGLLHLCLVIRDATHSKIFSKCDTYSHAVENDDGECSDVKLFRWGCLDPAFSSETDDR